MTNRPLTDTLDRFDPRWVRRALRLLEPQARYHRLEVRGLERIPEGPALLVGNHSGGGTPVDALLLTRYYRDLGTERPVRVMAHQFFFEHMGLAGPLARLGVLPASREYARAALDRGDRVLTFPGTDYDALRPFTDRDRVVLAGHQGFARLAIDAGVPVVPVASAGGHEGFFVMHQGLELAKRLGVDRRFRWHSFPLILCLPYGLAVGPMAYLPYLPLPAKITIEVGAPIAPRGSAEDLYQETEGRLQELVTGLYQERRYPVLG